MRPVSGDSLALRPVYRSKRRLMRTECRADFRASRATPPPPIPQLRLIEGELRDEEFTGRIGGLRRRNAVPISGRPVQHHRLPSRSSAWLRGGGLRDEDVAVGRVVLNEPQRELCAMILLPSAVTQLEIETGKWQHSHTGFIHRHRLPLSSRFCGIIPRYLKHSMLKTGGCL